MGFFADIIRDSRREGTVARTPEAPVSLGGDEAPAEAPPVVGGGPAEPATATGSETTILRLREEGGGKPVPAEQKLAQAGAAARQVVGPSPSEHTPVAGIPEVTVKGVILPNPVKREQAGCESDRTARGDFRVEQTESFHDGGSIDVPAVSVSENDSSVRESSSGYAALQTVKVSVETQGRRQAAESRAGSTTPPEPPSGEAVESWGPARTDKQAANGYPSAAATKSPAGVAQSGQAPPPTYQPHPPPDLPLEGGGPQIVSFVLGEEPRESSLPFKGRVGVGMGLSGENSLPATEEHFRRAIERQLPPLPREGDEGKTPARPLPPPQPQVRIGTIEVVVVAPAPAERPSRSEERSRPDLASRHYLRNF